jgi:hypothetical protein
VSQPAFPTALTSRTPGESVSIHRHASPHVDRRRERERLRHNGPRALEDAGAGDDDRSASCGRSPARSAAPGGKGTRESPARTSLGSSRRSPRPGSPRRRASTRAACRCRRSGCGRPPPRWRGGRPGARSAPSPRRPGLTGAPTPPPTCPPDRSRRARRRRRPRREMGRERSQPDLTRCARPGAAPNSHVNVRRSSVPESSSSALRTATLVPPGRRGTSAPIRLPSTLSARLGSGTAGIRDSRRR